MGKKKPPPAFKVGDAVRVKSGVTDPDFPDFPMGGWSGTVSEIQNRNPPLYLVALDERTIDNLHPVYRKRCQRDGLIFEQIWLSQEDLGPDQGDSPPIEQPAEVVPKPLNMRNWEDRVLTYLGLTSDDPLPEPDKETLRTFQEFLADKLSFPFPATYQFKPDSFHSEGHSITVIGLSDFDDSPWEEVGLCCLARRDGKKIELPLTEVKPHAKVPNRQVIEDSTEWYLEY